ncbi:kex protein [Panaeolus papilionaceus]|nr:kex protein [Panaeolus papilionaceus]
MHLRWTVLVSLLWSSHLASARPQKRHYDTHTYYALEHSPSASGATLEEVAWALGVEVIEQAGELEDVWLVRGPRPDGFDPRDEYVEERQDPVLETFKNLRRQASSTLEARSEEVLYARQIVNSVRYLELQTLRELEKRAAIPPTKASAKSVAQRLAIKDPLFTEQWHLVNDEFPEHMMNTTPVWDMGYTGKGVLTSFLDDGLDFESDDLKDAFDAENSYDFNAHVPLPRPTGVRDHHGTRCAGQVAARRNDKCGVGIAYDAKAAGVRILGGRITTVDEAAALNYGFKDVSIYSCSWGPRDNGQTMDAPSYLIRKAVVNGINKGRDGKGSIFVFASGNGGRDDDQCNFDGYTNSIYSVTVSSIDYKGLHPTYSETCAANMVVAYSSGSGNHIVTTDRNNECTKNHGGTSAAAPNAVGVFALALQARPELTWRDIQHLCVETARQVNPDDPDWEKTASGRYFSYKYGYGALDAYAYVTAAKSWKLVKPQAWIHTDIVRFKDGKVHDLGHKKYSYEGGEPIPDEGFEAKIMVTKEMVEKNNFEKLEHVDIRVWISHTKRGDVEVQLVSPKGIKSILANRRKYDEATTGFPGWRFMTVKHWGEDVIGDWTIRVTDQQDREHNGTFHGWNLAFWGSAVDPAKATQFVEPLVDNSLPPQTEPDRPVLNDPALTSSTMHAKPTDLLPVDHGVATGEKTRPAFPTGTGQPKATGTSDNDDASEAWLSHMASLIESQKWFFGAAGFASVFGIAAMVFFCRRQRRLAQYSSLAADDVPMGAIGQSRVVGGANGGMSRALYDAFGQPSPDVDDLPPPRTGNVTARANAGLGFHSGFLDDDELSAPLTTPAYRDDPEEEDPAHLHGEDDSRGEDEEYATPQDSREGSRERLT